MRGCLNSWWITISALCGVFFRSQHFYFNFNSNTASKLVFLLLFNKDSSLVWHLQKLSVIFAISIQFLVWMVAVLIKCVSSRSKRSRQQIHITASFASLDSVCNLDPKATKNRHSSDKFHTVMKNSTYTLWPALILADINLAITCLRDKWLQEESQSI